jgi:transcriptional regulator with XRE-family HTH domain
MQFQEASPQGRAIRLKLLRGMMQLTGQELAKKVDSTKTTVSYWENAKNNGLSDKGASHVIKLATERGILCTFEWLMNGIGHPPRLREGLPDAQMPTFYPTAEITLFTQQFPDTVILEILDETMEPAYSKGDKVGGIWQVISADTEIDEMNCIIELEGRLQVRRIKRAQTEKHYDLFHLRYDPYSPTPHVLQNILLTKIAPIIRVWR